MSRKSRERREKNKAVRPDDYFSNGIFEIAQNKSFACNV